MRLAVVLALFPLSAIAWEFSPDPICTLSETVGDASVVVTYDAAGPEYSISVTRNDQPWEDGVFIIQFDGADPFTITTDRQTLSDDRKTLTVRDAGFSNVLKGLENNLTAIAAVNQSGIAIPLDGIGAPMQAFRACPADQPATS